MILTGLYSHVSVCLKMWKRWVWRSEGRLNIGPWFVPEWGEKWKPCVVVTQVQQSSTSHCRKQPNSNFLSCVTHWGLFWWFGFESKGTVDVFHPKINTTKKIKTLFLYISFLVVNQPLASERACSGLLSGSKQRNWRSRTANQQTRRSRRCYSPQTPGSRPEPTRRPDNGEKIEQQYQILHLKPCKNHMVTTSKSKSQIWLRLVITCPANQRSSNNTPCLPDRRRRGITRGRRHRYQRKYCREMSHSSRLGSNSITEEV